MYPLKIAAILFLPAILFFTACSEEDEITPNLKGDIIGYAYCFDEFGNPFEDFSGITVFTEPNREYHAITDKNGRYVIKDVINGTYNLSFEKEGFGTMKLQSVKHLGGYPTVMESYTEGAPFIFGNITTQITNLEVLNDSLLASVSLSGQYKPDLLHLRLYFSTEKNFVTASAQAIKNVVFHEYYTMYKSITPISKILPFESGTTVYFKGCLYTDKSSSILLYNNYYMSGITTYFDNDSNKTIYPNLSAESEEFFFIMP
ncbi:MAG: carboxypeptidase-like regulatory domain-containing protein [Bacteroidota bacterium]